MKQTNEILMTLRSMATSGTLSGCFADIPIEVYHDPLCPGVSSTQIKAIMKRSYNHYILEKSHSTNPMRFGTAFHSFVNEPEAFVNSYEVVHGRAKGTRPEAIPLKFDDFQTIQKMSQKVFSHPDAAPLLKDAQNELTYFSIDSETGILKKCRVDAIKDGKISDLKTCEDASPSAFARDCHKYLYRISAAYYLEVVSEVLGRHLNNFYLIACEKSDPFEINVFRVDDRSLLKASEEIRETLRILKQIQDGGPNAWAGYKLGITDLMI